MIGKKLLSDAQLEEILDNKQLLKELEQSKAPISVFARERGISPARLYWLKKKAPFGVEHLADKRHENPGRPVKINEKAVAWIFHCLAEYPKIPMTKLQEKLREACRRHKIPAPSYKQIRRLIKTTSKDMVAFLKKGYDDWYEDDTLKARRQYGYPLQLVQMDATMLDIYVRDPITGQIYRPWLTAGIDMFSKVIPGFYLHRESPCARTSIAALRRIIMPSGRDDQPFSGQMETITVDQHGANVAGYIKQQMVSLGIDYKPNHPNCSDENGGIERWFRTLKEGLLTTLPGYTEQADALARAKQGCLTEEMLLERIHRWLLKYHMATHSSIRSSPWDKWKDNAAIAHGQVFDVTKVREALRVQHETKVLTDGVHMPDGRIFSSKDLVGYVGEWVVVMYDPEQPTHEIECYHDGVSTGMLKDVTCDPAMAKQINAARLARTKEFRKFRKRLRKIVAANPMPEPEDVAKVQAKANRRPRKKFSRKRPTAAPHRGKTPKLKPVEED